MLSESLRDRASKKVWDGVRVIEAEGAGRSALETRVCDPGIGPCFEE